MLHKKIHFFKHNFIKKTIKKIFKALIACLEKVFYCAMKTFSNAYKSH